MVVDMSARKVRSHEIYARMYRNSVKEAMEKEIITTKLVYNAILNFMTRNYEGLDYSGAVNYNNEIHHIMVFIGELTPREFMNIFPIQKVYYKGEDWKNYFTVMNLVKENGIDNKIAKPFEFVMEYLNTQITMFMVKVMDVMSQQHRFEKGKHINEEFYRDLGIVMPNERFILVKETAITNTFLDVKNNKVEKISKISHLKLIS